MSLSEADWLWAGRTDLGVPPMVEAAVVQCGDQGHVQDADLTRILLEHWVTLGLGFTVCILQKSHET